MNQYQCFKNFVNVLKVLIFLIKLITNQISSEEWLMWLLTLFLICGKLLTELKNLLTRFLEKLMS